MKNGKFLTAILTAICACFIGAAFSACGGKDHTHIYAVHTTEATCMENGVITYTCACGDSYTEEISATGHSYKDSNLCVEGDYIDTQCFTFTLLDDSAYSVKAKDGYDIPKNIVIPSSYEGLTVTSIDREAFYFCNKLTSIEIPDSITSIGDYAFYGCYRLTNIELSDSVMGIGNSALGFCSSLASISVSEDNKVYKSVDGDLYSKDGALLIRYAAGKEQEFFTIPNSVTNIGNSAFEDCYNLTSIVIPDSVTSIGDFAFEDCSRLTSIVIPDSVTNIGNSAFEACSGLTSITISNSVTNIGNSAFERCYDLTSIVIPDGVTSIGESAFERCYDLTSIVIPDGVTSIGDYAFGNCSSLDSVIIGNGVTSIGDYAFRNCSSLDSVIIGNGVTSIGNSAFRNCSSLDSVIIGNGVTSIGSYAFYDCSSLMSVIIGDSLTSIGNSAFGNCYKLVEVVNKSTHITVEQGASSNGSVAYYALAVYHSGNAYESKISNDNGYVVYIDGDKKILVGYTGTETDLVLPSYITDINSNAFIDCDNLTSIVIPDGVTSIGRYAFGDCHGLRSVVLPNSVTSIGASAFKDCYNLVVYYKATAEDWESIAFGSYNSNLVRAVRYYYSETEPATTGKFWHYDENGEIVIWQYANDEE